MKKRRRGSPNLERSLRRTLEPLEKMKMEEWSLEKKRTLGSKREESTQPRDERSEQNLIWRGFVPIYREW